MYGDISTYHVASTLEMVRTLIYRYSPNFVIPRPASSVRAVSSRPRASELVRCIRCQARPGMPMDDAPYLTDEEIQLIEDWITQSARNSEGQAAVQRRGA